MRGDVVFLFRISDNVIEFGFGRIYVVIAASFQRMQRAPAKRTERIEGLAVGRAFAVAGAFQKTYCLELLLDWIFYAGQLKKSRRHADGFHRCAHPSGPKAAPSRRFHDQRYANRGIVNKKSVLTFSVLAKRFAVIAEKYDQSATVELIALEPGQEPSELVIGVCDFSIIGVVTILGTVRLGRIVGAVRVVQVQP